MKTTFFFVAISISFLISFSQTTYVPDNNFEAYLEANGMGNGIPNDDLVTTANISGVTTLGLINLNINDFTGLSGFTSLTSLTCTYNNMTSIDLSANTALINLYCHNNYYLTGIDLSQNINLKNLDLGYDVSITSLNIDNNTALEALNTRNIPLVTLNLTLNTALRQLDCVNNQLTSLNVSQNTALQSINVVNNKLTSLDFSNNPTLSYIWGGGNLLESLNVKNGFNSFMPDGNFYMVNNPSLTCITVDNAAYSSSTWFNIDPQSYFNENCALGINELELGKIKVFPNPSKDKFYIDLQLEASYTLTNVFGQQVKKGALLIGTNELDTQSLASGLYLLKLETPEGSATKKLIKE